MQFRVTLTIYRENHSKNIITLCWHYTHHYAFSDKEGKFETAKGKLHKTLVRSLVFFAMYETEQFSQADGDKKDW
jgi:hypothetical protein